MTKTIDRDTYLKALGLFTLAVTHARKAEEFEKALNMMLGLARGSQFSDEIYQDAPNNFDDALKREKITVEPVEDA